MVELPRSSPVPEIRTDGQEKPAKSSIWLALTARVGQLPPLLGVGERLGQSFYSLKKNPDELSTHLSLAFGDRIGRRFLLGFANNFSLGAGVNQSRHRYLRRDSGGGDGGGRGEATG